MGDQTEEDEDENLLAVEVDDDQSDHGSEKVEKPISVEQLEENTKQKYLSMVIRILRFL